MRTVVIVDAYSSGRFLAPEFKKRGYCCVHLQSTKVKAEIFHASYMATDFSEQIIHDDDYQKTREAVRRLEPVCVIPGSETGVELADQLSESLGLKSNGTKLSNARRDKFAMVEAVRQAKVPTIASFQARTVEEGEQWVASGQIPLPVIVKPLKSAGTDQVRLCQSSAELGEQLKNIIGKANRLGYKNQGALIQEFVEGDEYIVDTVSIDGVHKVCALWKYHKRQTAEGAIIYEASEILPLNDPLNESLRQTLTDYTFRVIDALAIRFGPCHAEIMLTKRGPLLIEIAARLDGSDAPIFGERAYGISQAHLTADCYLDQRDYWRRLDTSLPIKEYCLLAYLVSNQSGVVSAIQNLDTLRGLKSFRELALHVKVGEKILKTVDLFSNPGWVNLGDQSREQVWSDYRAIRRLEAEQAIFDLASRPRM